MDKGIQQGHKHGDETIDVPVAVIISTTAVSEEQSPEGSAFFFQLVRNYHRYSLIIILSWVGVVGVGAWALPQCLKNFNSTVRQHHKNCGKGSVHSLLTLCACDSPRFHTLFIGVRADEGGEGK